MATILSNAGRALITALLLASNIKYIGWGTGAGTAAATDTTLFTAAAETRATGTQSQQTTSVTNDTYRVVGTMTCASVGKTITNAGVFDASTDGNMLIKGDFTGVPLQVGDSIQFTFNLQFT